MDRIDRIIKGLDDQQAEFENQKKRMFVEAMDDICLCPSCFGKLKINLLNANKKHRCPKCKTVFTLDQAFKAK